MGVPREMAENGIRVSLGWETTEADIDRLIAAWSELYCRIEEKARRKSA
jgi:cysteine desulfurase